MKHTPEPWKAYVNPRNGAIGVYSITTENDVAGCNHLGLPANARKANANRIVACVNACAGIEDPASAISDAREALELALEVIEATGPGSYPIAENAIAGALAKLKGGAE